MTKEKEHLDFLEKELFNADVQDLAKNLSFFVPPELEKSVSTGGFRKKREAATIFEFVANIFSFNFATPAAKAIEKLVQAANIKLQFLEKEKEKPDFESFKTPADLAYVAFDTIASTILAFPRNDADANTKKEMMDAIKSIINNMIHLGEGTSYYKDFLQYLFHGIPPDAGIRGKRNEPRRYFCTLPLSCYLLSFFTSIGADWCSDDNYGVGGGPVHLDPKNIAELFTFLLNDVPSFELPIWPIPRLSESVMKEVTAYMSAGQKWDAQSLTLNHPTRSVIHQICDMNRYFESAAVVILNDVLSSGKLHPRDASLANDESCLAYDGSYGMVSPLYFAAANSLHEIVRELCANNIGGCDLALEVANIQQTFVPPNPNNVLGVLNVVASIPIDLDDDENDKSKKRDYEKMKQTIVLLLSRANATANAKSTAMQTAILKKNYPAFEVLAKNAVPFQGGEAFTMAKELSSRLHEILSDNQEYKKWASGQK